MYAHFKLKKVLIRTFNYPDLNICGTKIQIYAQINRRNEGGGKKEPPQWPHSSYVVVDNGSHIVTRRCGVEVLKREKNQGA